MDGLEGKSHLQMDDVGHPTSGNLHVFMLKCYPMPVTATKSGKAHGKALDLPKFSFVHVFELDQNTVMGWQALAQGPCNPST